MMRTSAAATLFEALCPGAALEGARRAWCVPVAVLFLVVSARLQVPFWPVPMTMQSAAVILLGAALGPRLGVAAVVLYLALGAAGLPVFAATPERGAGLAYMAGPTGGYLVGFIAAAWIAGTAARTGWDRRLFTACVTATAATAVVTGLGWAWLAWLIGPQPAFAAGVLPFLPAEAVKIALVTCLQPLAWTLLHRPA